MTPNRHEGSRRPRGLRSGLACLVGVIALVIGSAACAAKPGAVARPGAQAPAEQGVRWQDLKPAQQLALKPLKREWSSLDKTRKRKWLRIASRYAKLSASEQARLQARMTDWSDLTPQQRGQARLNFREARELPREDRQARWEAYQALSPEQKQELADRATASRPGHRGHRSNPKARRSDKHNQVDAAPKPRHGASRRPAAPTMVRAGHGATTTLISRQPAPRRDGGQPRSAATPRAREPGHLAAQASTAATARHRHPRHTRHAGIRPRGVASTMNAAPGKLPPMPDSRRTVPVKSDVTAPGPHDGRNPIAPSLVRRMACFIYEGLLLFGIGLIPGALGAIFVALTGHQQLAQIDTVLRVITFAIYALYFTWFWSARGQTLAMQTWNIRVVTTQGRPLGRWRALARYVASWAWVAPAALVAHLNGWTPVQSLAAVGVGVVAYALLALAHPQRQFWHDALCGSRLIDARPIPTA